ncbi:MAG: SpoIIIAH-like family protein [Clostridia bacterium]|nr:SpoIIIAH-like family protein [Clostridia bacterium]
MKLKPQLTKMKEKLKTLEWKRLIGTKAFITVGCVMLVGIAVFVSSLVNGIEQPAATDESASVLGNTVLVDSTVSTETETGATQTPETPETPEDFFAMAIINRTQVRDSALEVLREIAENPDSLPDAKEEALSSIADIADDMSAEANIETLVKAKGIAECVAVINGEKCSVIVNTSELVADELTQITDIVYEQTGIAVHNITVVEAR